MSEVELREVLQSHGPGSSLIAHSIEATLGTLNEFERISAGQHDCPKATAQWQAYSAGGFSVESPHEHAALGAVLASLLLHELGAPEWEIVKALVANAAHHSQIERINAFGPATGATQAARKFFRCASAKAHFCEMAPRALGYDSSAATRAWAKAKAYFDTADDIFAPPQPITAPFSLQSSLSLYLECRSFLGRLCIYDMASAIKQSGGEWWDPVYFKREFLPRPGRILPSDATELNRLRTLLRVAAIDMAEQLSPRRMGLIVMPTGLGKTNAGFDMATRVAQRLGLERVIYAAPVVSISEQVFDTDLQRADASISTHLRKESNAVEGANPRKQAVANRVSALANQMDTSYIVMTLKKLLWLVGDPSKKASMASYYLRNAVVIIDEPDALPRHVLACALRILQEYAVRNNLVVIIMSATMPPLKMMDMEDIECATLPADVHDEIWNSPFVCNRRRFTKHRRPKMTIEELRSEIDAFHATSDRSLLVVLNLVNKGTLPLSEMFTGSSRADLRTHCMVGERHVFFLDNLVPPWRRREIIRQCRELLARGTPVTLIATPVIEAGVDVDFDELWDDFKSLRSSIQRAGRNGRNYIEGRQCWTRIFCLVVPDKHGTLRESREVLFDNYEPHRSDLMDRIRKEEAYVHRAEGEWFARFDGESKEDALNDALKKILLESCRVDFADLRRMLFEVSPKDFIGFERSHEIARAVDPITEQEGQEEAVVITNGDRDAYLAQLEVVRNSPSRKEIRTLQEMRAQHLIRSVSSEAIARVVAGMRRVADDDGRPVYCTHTIF